MMATTPRIPRAEISGPSGWLLTRFSRKILGDVPEAMGVMWHNRKVLFGSMRFGRKVEKWDRLDGDLKTYAHMAVASLVGCSWCLDFNYFKAHNSGLDDAKASEVPRWRETTVFTALERDVMEYAEAMSETPPRVTDELVERLLLQLGAAALVELTAVVGFANSTTRGNVALGIESQGFSGACSVPLARRSVGAAVSA
jgi:alkylhydroperoxidase family enzyme